MPNVRRGTWQFEILWLRMLILSCEVFVLLNTQIRNIVFTPGISLRRGPFQKSGGGLSCFESAKYVWAFKPGGVQRPLSFIEEVAYPANYLEYSLLLSFNSLPTT